ncbi:MAG: DNA double-strand break repair protein Mre11 [Halodesulfurarchaeum sp.]
MVRVIHTGDTHVGYRQYHSRERRQDFLEAFESVVEDAIEMEVDAVLHAGDLFHDRRPDLQDLLGTISILEPLRDADIPFLAIVGNHEDTRRGQWLDLFERLDLATHLDDSPERIGNTAFYGLDYVPESKRGDLEYRFEPTDTEYAALLGHGLFSPFPHGDWDLHELLEQSTVDFDAVLLGDDHTPDVRQIEDTWVTYCGSTERTSASEREARGYNIVEFEESASITRRGLDTRDFVFLDVELRKNEGAARIRERIRESAVEDAVVVVTVTGGGDSIVPAQIEEFGDEQGALLTRVNDRREFDESASTEVHFADPDEAVKNRVRELGLSDAARGIDETVRAEDIARSNVRERTKEHVRSLLSTEGAFDSAGKSTGDDGEKPEEESEQKKEPKKKEKSEQKEDLENKKREENINKIGVPEEGNITENLKGENITENLREENITENLREENITENLKEENITKNSQTLQTEEENSGENEGTNTIGEEEKTNEETDARTDDSQSESDEETQTTTMEDFL